MFKLETRSDGTNEWYFGNRIHFANGENWTSVDFFDTNFHVYSRDYRTYSATTVECLLCGKFFIWLNFSICRFDLNIKTVG